MATTSTTTTRQDHLHDYNIRLTGGSSGGGGQDASTTGDATRRQGLDRTPVENPPGWYDGHRQVPPFRPVNRNLDRVSRPWGSNPIETAFVMHMFHGVWLKSWIAWAWNVTGGRISKDRFTAKIGGEI